MLAGSEPERASLADLASACLELQQAAAAPCASHANATIFSTFARLATVVAAQSGSSRQPCMLAPLTACMRDAVALAREDSSPGWLLRAAAAGHRHEAYVAFHERLLGAALVRS